MTSTLNTLPPQRSAHSSAADGGPAKVLNLRIVLVEDEALIAVLLEDLLTDMGHHVCATESTQENAIAAFLRESPDLMIVDCRLRKGCGIKAMADILKNAFVPHIFMTGGDLRGQALHPAAVILKKPFLDDDLTAAIAKAISTGPARRY
ncbi:response regulator [Rhizobium sp. FY34]|uniref:response regulator n=1 Tax=Rhizobium sp. FY34 TaxID=2562309 RepID=UPI001FEF8093|nr:response regulator [Rhizobium sp. FY34]